MKAKPKPLTKEELNKKLADDPKFLQAAKDMITLLRPNLWR